MQIEGQNVISQFPLLTTKSDSKRKLQYLPLRRQETEALHFLLPLSHDYPGIDVWYRAKVVPGLRDGTRTLLRIERDGNLVGLGIAKCEADERKICTVRVAPSHAGRGIGIRLFDGLLKWLNDDRPHLTVTHSKLPVFERIFDYYGFNMTSAAQGRYVPHACELGYNEPLHMEQMPLIEKYPLIPSTRTVHQSHLPNLRLPERLL
jgi:GNAT superfamily N-acetyltransferase